MALTNEAKYFAEGVQAWFNVNAEANPTNGVHNHVNTRAELQAYDRTLYGLLEQYFAAAPNEDRIPDVIVELGSGRAMLWTKADTSAISSATGRTMRWF